MHTCAKERIDGPDLHAVAAAVVSQLGRFDVILELGHDHGKQGEVADDSLPDAGPAEPLKQLLKDQSGCDHDIAALQALPQERYLGDRGRRRSSKSKRPHARVDEEVHSRERSDL